MAKRSRKKIVDMSVEEVLERTQAYEQVGEAGVPFVDAVAKNIAAHEREAVELSEPPAEVDISEALGALKELEDTADAIVSEYGPDEDQSEEEEKPPTSVVAEKFKLKYIENARAAGIAGKAAKRSSWDWLAQRIAEQCLGEKEKINIADFMDLLECNGVDYSRWTNRNKGWEGRFRMTGRVALQKVVANAGVLKTMSGESVPPPEWVEKYRDKS